LSHAGGRSDGGARNHYVNSVDWLLRGGSDDRGRTVDSWSTVIAWPQEASADCCAAVDDACGLHLTAATLVP